MVIYAVANQKGGVGKTTSAINLAAGLALAGRRVLVVDLDPQANLTAGLGLREAAGQQPTAYDAITGRCTVQDALLERPLRGTAKSFHVVPGHLRLTGLPLELATDQRRGRRLADALEATKDFDVCVVDCPPTLGLLLQNAFIAAAYVLVPVKPEFWDLDGIRQLMMTLRKVRTTNNPDLRLAGAFGTHYDQRRGIHIEYLSALRERLGKHFFRTVIRTDTKVSEAPSHGLSIFEYAPRTHASDDYRHLTTELLERHDQK